MDYTNPYARFGVNMNPMQYQMNPMQSNWQQPVQVTRVSGMDGARSFASSLPPNSTATAFDNDRDVFYFIKTDGGGFPTVEPYSFAKLQQADQQNADYVTHDELNSVIEKIQEMIQNAQQPVSAAEPTSKPARSRKPATSGQSD